MGPLSLLALLSGALMLAALDDDDAPLAEDATGGDDPDPEPDLDTGATFDIDPTTGAVTIDVGDDESRSLAIFTYVNSQDDPDDFYTAYEARYYLVPENVDLSGNTWETQGDIPGASEFGTASGAYDLAAMEQQLGLELLGVVDLGTENVTGGFPVQGGVADDLPTLVSNQPADIYYVEAVTDGDAIATFLPADFVVTVNGAVQTTAAEDTTGTAGSDWLVATADGILLEGVGGDDRLEAAAANVTLDGGAGDDNLIGTGGADVTALGGAGNDQIDIDSGVGSGGPGDDVLYSFGSGTAMLEGGDGDDTIQASGALSEVVGGTGDDVLSASGQGASVHGGTGDDFVGARGGATGYGDAGDDRLQVDAGSQGFGGDGDDVIEVWEFHNADAGPAIVTGGAGADTFDALVRNPANGEADTLYMRITDFDPGEDVLQVGLFQTTGVEVADIDIIPTTDGSASDVRITFTSLSGLPPGISVIRLDGVTGLTPDDIVIVA